MASSKFKRGFQRTALSAALGLCLAGGVYAQSASGSLFGRADAGSTVVVEDPSTGVRREINVQADGTYRASQLPIGSYRVVMKRADGTEVSRDNVRVTVGTGTPINFTAASADATLGAIDVVGDAINPIDVSSVESTTVLTAEKIAKVPVPRDTTSVALLAPGTVRGDARFGNLASFGGASVAENQYFVNGFNVTNTFRNINFSQIPFEAIAQQQVKTGGYGAEFGRSLGGVVSQITKRGTNDFQAGGNVFWTPSSLTSAQEDLYFSNPLHPDFGDLAVDNQHNNGSTYTVSAWASGALIQDTLFAYALISQTERASDNWPGLSSRQNFSTDSRAPTWLLKMDWNINEDNLLEFTAFSDKNKQDVETYLNTADTISRTGFLGTSHNETGGENYVLRYTGYVTDNFTLSALYGHGEFSRSTQLEYADGSTYEYDGDFNAASGAGCPIIIDARPAARRAATGTYGSTCNITGGSLNRSDSGDTRDQFRLDAEWSLGDHLVRFGYDRDDYESVAGTRYEGGSIWRYATLSNGTDIVREQIVAQGATVKLEQEAFYIEDTWQLTDNFMLYGGLRWDTFTNKNGDGDAYVEIKNQLGPRLGFSWDVNGDSTLKVFGNAGRYALPLTPSVAVRGASASIFTRETFFFDGVDPVTGAPINPVSRGDFFTINGEDGNSKNPATIASSNLKPMYQDEYILGAQKQLTDSFSVGVRGIYRDLKTAIDDNCDYGTFLDQAGFEYDSSAHAFVRDGQAALLPSSGLPYCRMFNPGEDAIWLSDFFGTGQLEETTIAGELLAPKAKRTYQAVEVFFEGNWDKFFLQGSYTWAKSKGNTEGGVKSDLGQADTSVTQDFDYLELTVDTYGYLPNDRRHSLKLFGNYEITDQWSVGANLLVQSGRPMNCLGLLDLNPGPGTSFHPYGSSFMRCGTSPDGQSSYDPTEGESAPPVSRFPRGTFGRLPWTEQLDLNVSYAPNWAEGLTFKVDVFNVFNNQKVTSVSERAEDSTTGLPLSTFMLPLSNQAPRSVRFMIQYDFK